MAEPDEALVEVVARALCAVNCDSRFSPAPWVAHEHEARAAVKAMVEHLGLVEGTSGRLISTARRSTKHCECAWCCQTTKPEQRGEAHKICSAE